MCKMGSFVECVFNCGVPRTYLILLSTLLKCTYTPNSFQYNSLIWLTIRGKPIIIKQFFDTIATIVLETNTKFIRFVISHATRIFENYSDRSYSSNFVITVTNIALHSYNFVTTQNKLTVFVRFEISVYILNSGLHGHHVIENVIMFLLRRLYLLDNKMCGHKVIFWYM